MNNLAKIRKFSKTFYFILSVMMAVIPLYYILYWTLINYLPETLINVNVDAAPLIPHQLTLTYRITGFVVCLLPLSAILYGLANMRKLFSFYKEGVIFSFEHVGIFKNTAKALISWVIFSMLYESAKSVLFTMGNPPGSRMIRLEFSSAEITSLLVGGIVFIISWVMDEGRMLSEENKLTI